MEAAKAKRILFILRLLIGLCIAFTVIGCICMISHGILKFITYRQLVGISSATEKDIRTASYIQAIRLDPGKPDAYIMLLKAYGEDGLLEKQESEEFLSTYNAYHQKLKKRAEGYGELQKVAGFLYINGYDESTTTCIRMAMPFLEEAYEYLPDTDPEKQTVACYCKIGSYYEDFIWNAATIREISPEVMESLLAGIESTLAYFHQNTDTSSVYDYLGFSVAVCNLLYDQRDILATTVPQDRTETVLNSIYDNLPEMGTLQQQRTQQLLQTLETNRDTYVDMIQRAYSRKGAA